MSEKYSEIFHNFLTDVRNSWKQNIREKAKNNEDIFDVGWEPENHLYIPSNKGEGQKDTTVDSINHKNRASEVESGADDDTHEHKGKVQFVEADAVILWDEEEEPEFKNPSSSGKFWPRFSHFSTDKANSCLDEKKLDSVESRKWDISMRKTEHSTPKGVRAL